jgi:hypothetical protein
VPIVPKALIPISPFLLPPINAPAIPESGAIAESAPFKTKSPKNGDCGEAMGSWPESGSLLREYVE